MSGHHLISPTDLRDYAKSRGWSLLQEAIKDRLYVLASDQFPRRQLVFPMDTTAPDYAEAVGSVVDKLSELEKTSVDHILGRLQEVREDTVYFRLHSEQIKKSIPLTLASASLSGAQNLLLAAASTVLRPRRHHRRMGFADALKLTNAARFRHTETGSFVVRVSCPLNAVDIQGSFLVDDPHTPFVRRSTTALRNGLYRLVSAIESDTIDELVRSQTNDEAPILSSNLCEAITRFYDDVLDNSLEVTFGWAATAPMASPEFAQPIRIQSDYFPRIEEVAQALRSDDPERVDTFIGTVESLSGEMQQDGHRAGEVIMMLFLSEGETIRARAYLDSAQYSSADKAHMTEKMFVKISGKLHSGRQPRLLSDLTQFETVSPE